MYNMRKRLLFVAVLVLLAGFVVGNITPVNAATSYFAGYNYYTSSVTGVLARLPYGNPNVPVSGGFPKGWALAWGANSYIQAGWIKNYGNSAPQYFVEYWNGCGQFCRYTYGTIDSNTHEYKVQQSGSNWCGYIDGYQKAPCVPTSQLGFTTASNEQYFGETTNTSIQLGGTGTSHFRMTRLSFQLSSVWTQVNTNNLSIYVSPGTSYHANAGFTSPDTWEDNWTQ